MQPPIIEEIHKIREAHARKFNNDLDAIFDDLQEKQATRNIMANLKPVKPPLAGRARCSFNTWVMNF